MRPCYQRQIPGRPTGISAPDAHTPGSFLTAQVVATVHPGYAGVYITANAEARAPLIDSETQSMISRSR